MLTKGVLHHEMEFRSQIRFSSDEVECGQLSVGLIQINCSSCKRPLSRAVPVWTVSLLKVLTVILTKAVQGIWTLETLSKYSINLNSRNLWIQS